MKSVEECTCVSKVLYVAIALSLHAWLSVNGMKLLEIMLRKETQRKTYRNGMHEQMMSYWWIPKTSSQKQVIYPFRYVHFNGGD